ncbi:MAG: SBBP repeat-containing protein [Candidatus Sifarchaeia archaeon]
MKCVELSRMGLILLILLFLSPLLVRAENTTEQLDNRKTVTTVANPFLENKGQINDSHIYYYSRVQGGYLVVGDDGIIFLNENNERNEILHFEECEFLCPMGVGEQTSITHFYLGDRGTYTNVHSYSEVAYNEIKPGVDIIISMQNEGAFLEVRTEENIDSSTVNKLLMNLDSENGFYLDQINDFENIHYPFHILTDNKGNIQIQQAADLSLSRYFGGSNNDIAHAITRDSSGNLYITGETSSSNFPLVNELYPFRGATDAFITMLDSDGAIVYSTYIGGSYTTLESRTAWDSGQDIVVDSEGSVYVTGTTQSDDFPTLNPMYSVALNETLLRNDYYAYEGDVFLLKLNSNGQLNFSTYFGGSHGENAYAIALDGNEDVYIAGRTSSYPGSTYSFPLVDAFDTQSTYQSEGFITCISSTGDEVLFSSYLGGSGDDYIYDIAIGSDGDIVATGYTQGGLPLTSPLNSTHGGGLDVFVAKIDSSGDVVYSTYLGGRGDDEGNSIAIDDSGIVYVTGRTYSQDYPVENAFFNTYLGDGDCFISAISDDGLDLVFSSFIGGSGIDNGKSISVDAAGGIYVAGSTWSVSFPINAEVSNGGQDAFVLKTNLDEIMHFRCIGGSGNDEANAMAIDNLNNTYVCGRTQSSDFPITDQSSNMGGYDAFIFSYELIYVPYQPPYNGGILGTFEMTTILVTGISLIAGLSAIQLFVRYYRRREYEVTMKEVPEPLWNHPPDTPDGAPAPEPLWNHPPDTPDGAPTPEPLWNHPPDTPDGTPTPEPLWNHPPDTPDGTPTPKPMWNHPPDTPDGTPTQDPLWNHPPDTPDGTPTPKPMWNHPPDTPDGTPTARPLWNHPPDTPDGRPTPQPLSMIPHDLQDRTPSTKLQLKDAASIPIGELHPDGCICPMCKIQDPDTIFDYETDKKKKKRTRKKKK